MAIVYPDREPDETRHAVHSQHPGDLKSCPHPEAARRLVDYLLSPAWKQAGRGPSAQIPLNPAVDAPSAWKRRRTVKAMQVDFAAAADEWDAASQFVRDEFLSD